MKKQFFYAAMAVALMASCTSEDDLSVNPVEPTPDAEEQVAINLGVTAPSMTLGSRATGTGMVGYVEGTADGVAWDSQELFIAMVDRATNKVYNDPEGTPYFAGLEFRAPSKPTSGDNNQENIRIYKEGTYNEADPNKDKGTLEYKYYPVAGKYDFYGWHVDNAELTLKDSKPDTLFAMDGTTKQALVKGIKIDGTQDLLAAKTIEIPNAIPAATEPGYKYHNSKTASADWDEMNKNQFNARTARNGFTPILDFQHTLARLKFYAKAGEGTDAAKNYMKEDVDSEGNPLGTYSIATRTPYSITDANWDDENGFDYNDLEGMLDGAIYVTEVKVLGVYDNVELDLVNTKAQIKENSAIATNGFTLMSTPAQATAAGITPTPAGTKILQALVPVAPKYAADYTGTKVPADYKADEIGESIMFLPVEGEIDPNTSLSTGTDQVIKIQVKLGQCLIKTEDETKQTTDPAKFTYYWDESKPVTLTLNASSIELPTGPNAPTDKIFKAGRSYNVYITIYGRERIEVSASLAPWTEGGDINTDIENGI